MRKFQILTYQYFDFITVRLTIIQQCGLLAHFVYLRQSLSSSESKVQPLELFFIQSVMVPLQLTNCYLETII